MPEVVNNLKPQQLRAWQIMLNRSRPGDLSPAQGNKVHHVNCSAVRDRPTNSGLGMKKQDTLIH